MSKLELKQLTVVNCLAVMTRDRCGIFPPPNKNILIPLMTANRVKEHFCMEMFYSYCCTLIFVCLFAMAVFTQPLFWGTFVQRKITFIYANILLCSILALKSRLITDSDTSGPCCLKSV